MELTVLISPSNILWLTGIAPIFFSGFMIIVSFSCCGYNLFLITNPQFWINTLLHTHLFLRRIFVIHQIYKVTFYILKYFKSLIFFFQIINKLISRLFNIDAKCKLSMTAASGILLTSDNVISTCPQSTVITAVFVNVYSLMFTWFE